MDGILLGQYYARGNDFEEPLRAISAFSAQKKHLLTVRVGKKSNTLGRFRDSSGVIKGLALHTTQAAGV